MPLGMVVGLGPGDFMLDGNPAPLPKKGAEPPIFGPCPVWPNGWMDQDETWHAGRPRPWPHCVRRGPISLSPKGAQPPPQFSANICCGQMAGWIKMPLSMAVGFGPCDIVLDGNPASSSPKRGPSPQFFAHVYCDQTAGWIKMAVFL